MRNYRQAIILGMLIDALSKLRAASSLCYEEVSLGGEHTANIRISPVISIVEQLKDTYETAIQSTHPPESKFTSKTPTTYSAIKPTA